MPPELRIDGRSIGLEHPTYFIAELGSNHDGHLDRAEELVCAAARAGADAVKLQSFTAAGLSRRGEPAFSLLEQLEVPDAWHSTLQNRARAEGIQLISTPFDEERADLLNAIGVPAFKIASGDLTHHPLLRHVAGLGRPVLLSTGLASLDEIRDAVNVLHEGGALELALLHCVSAYPARFAEMNIRAVERLARDFSCVVGLSDHTPRHSAVIAAVALGARIVEKHVTFDRTLEGPDHGYSLTFDEFAQMVRDVRDVEVALGDGEKQPAPGETLGRRQGRRSVHAATDIPAGTLIETSMLKIVRPAEGAPPSDSELLVGRRSVRALCRDEPVQWGDVR